MISQKWIHSGKSELMCITRYNEKCNKYCVILLAGYSLPMCDVDFFMTRLADSFLEAGIFSMQVDLTGTGDSSGELYQLNVKKAKEDIENIYKYAMRMGFEHIGFVSRGLSALIVSDLEHHLDYDFNIAINPYHLSREYIKNNIDYVNSKKFKSSDFLQGTDYSNFSDFNKDRLIILLALGARIRNVHGQCLSGDLFNELREINARKILQTSNKSIYLFVDNYAENEISSDFLKYIYYDRVEELKRTPNLQMNLINLIICESKERWHICENPNSN